MERRLVWLVVCLLLAENAASAVVISATSSQASAFDIGYGPSVLFPSTGGTPVFTTGDQLWVRSYSNLIVDVRVSELFSNLTYFSGALAPGTPTRLLTFNATDLQGLWVLAGGSSAPVTFIYSAAGAAPINFTLAGAGLNGGSLGLNFTTAPSAQLLGAQACLLDSGDSSAALVQVPSIVGGGTMALTLKDHSIAVTAEGPAPGNYSVQVDMYHSYWLLSPNSTSILLSRSARAATTGGALITKENPSATLALQEDSPLKLGRYQVRVFFDGGNGVALATADVLVTGEGAWVWMGRCASTPVYSNDFHVSLPLGTDPASWPRTALLTYTSLGVQGYAELPLGLNLTAVTFTGAPWGVPLSGYQIETVPSGASDLSLVNGTVFAVMHGPEISVGYALGLGGQTFFRGTVGPLLPFTSHVVSFDLSRLEVTYFEGGSPYEGGTVSVADAKGALQSQATGADGTASFYLPPGTYNVTASGGGNTAEEGVTLVPGESAAIDMGQTNSGGTAGAITWVLAAAALAGVMLNVAVYFRRKNAGARAPGTPPS